MSSRIRRPAKVPLIHLTLYRPRHPGRQSHSCLPGTITVPYPPSAAEVLLLPCFEVPPTSHATAHSKFPMTRQEHRYQAHGCDRCRAYQDTLPRHPEQPLFSSTRGHVVRPVQAPVQESETATTQSKATPDYSVSWGVCRESVLNPERDGSSIMLQPRDGNISRRTNHHVSMLKSFRDVPCRGQLYLNGKKYGRWPILLYPSWS